jgi:hypothetical protein
VNFESAAGDRKPGWLSRYSDELDGRGSIPGKERDFSHVHSVQTHSGALPAFYPVPGTLSPRIKRPEHEVYHSPPSSAEVKNGGAILLAEWAAGKWRKDKYQHSFEDPNPDYLTSRSNGVGFLPRIRKVAGSNIRLQNGYLDGDCSWFS